MWFASGRRLIYLCVVVLLATPLWVCFRVGAIRILPENGVANAEFNRAIMDNKSKEDLFNKYFSGRNFGPSNRTKKGFDESKRRVPSCPDPLHN